ncbi:hypothetical protein HID58_048572, partial [Brassica napus]
ELKRRYISFFDIEKHETMNSRLGLEQIRLVKVCDLRHRYGHNLHFYNECLHCQSTDSSTGNYFSPTHFSIYVKRFDIGNGKEVNLVEKCLN